MRIPKRRCSAPNCKEQIDPEKVAFAKTHGLPLPDYHSRACSMRAYRARRRLRDEPISEKKESPRRGKI